MVDTLRYLADSFDAALENALARHHDNPTQALRAILSLQFDESYASAEQVSVWNAFRGESLARTEYRKICGQTALSYLESVRSLCVAIGEPGQYASMSIEAVVRALDGMVESLVKDLLVVGDDFDREAAMATCMSFLASVFPHHFLTPEDEQAGHLPLETNPRLLAPWTYFDSELFSIEADVLFKRTWQMLGHVNEVANPGDYKTSDLLGDRALVIRGEDLKLRAFHNVCRHRGSRVVAAETGNCPRSIVCPFHGWRYGFDGQLQLIPQADRFSNLNAPPLGQVPLDMEIWMGLIFVRFRSEGCSVTELMAPVEQRLEPYRLAAMQPVGGDHVEEVKVNWKALHDIDNEGYHIPVGHPALNTLLSDHRDNFFPNGVTTSEATITARPSHHWSVAHYQQLQSHFDHLPEDSRRSWFYWSLFPNLSLAVYPEGFEYYRSVPVDVETTLMVGGYYALPDDRREARAARYLNERINRVVTREDYRLVHWAYEAMRSSVYPRDPDRLSEFEYGVANFHRRIREQIPVAGEENPPPRGTMAARNATLMSSSKERMTI